MKNLKRKLQIEQLDRRFKAVKGLTALAVPADGWIKTTRDALGMSLKQLGAKMAITAQSVKEIEQREKNKNITLRTLNEAAEALNLKLVYGLLPKGKDLTAMINERAEVVAKKIVLRTAKTMQLENQTNSATRLKKAIKNRAEEIKNNQPRYLWD
jgi:predicted DNA-binding mobile mystery protein A